MTVVIDDETARTAYRELDILIKETDGDGSREPMSPLALAKKYIEEAKEEADDSDVKLGMSLALYQLRRVGEATGAEIAPIDPLQDDIFQAKKTLDNKLTERA